MVGRIATRSDCASCAALCCIAYPSGEMPGFAAEKRSGEPCPKLDTCGGSTIYDDRERLGFAGCIAYECFGAGQFVTQAALAHGGEPGDRATQAMIDHFLGVRPAFDLLYLAQRWESTVLPGKEIGEGLALVLLLEDALLTGVLKDIERILPAAKARLRELYAARIVENGGEILNSRGVHALDG